MTIERFSEAVHAKNMKLFSQHLEAWRTSTVSNLTSEVGYMYFDVQRNKYLGSSSNSGWRDRFHEKDLDISGTSLLNEGCFILPTNSVIKSEYDRLTDSSQMSYKTLFCRKDTYGFELFGVLTNKELSIEEQLLMNKSLFNLSYEVNKWIKTKQHIYTEIKAYDMARSKFDASYTQPEIEYDKSKFKGNLILTTKEQKLIEMLIYQYTQKQIADHRGCTETAVRKSIANIKRKLGFEHMSTSHMMVELKRLGVLGIYASVLT